MALHIGIGNFAGGMYHVIHFSHYTHVDVSVCFKPLRQTYIDLKMLLDTLLGVSTLCFQLWWNCFLCVLAF